MFNLTISSKKAFKNLIFPLFPPQDFHSAKRPCTFVLKLQRGKYFPGEYLVDADFQLQLEHNAIGEQLHGKLVDGTNGEQCFQISRHQANANAGQQLEEWVEEIERKCRNETRIRLYDTTIGFAF